MISAALFSIGLALTGGASHQTDNTAGLVVIDRAPAVEIAIADTPPIQVGVDGFTMADPCTAGTGPCPPTAPPAPTPVFGVDCGTGGRPAPCDPGPAPTPSPVNPGLCTGGRPDTGGNCH